METNNFDVAIIGAGVCGCATARELSRYNISVCVLEREEDVCCGTTKANAALVHAGHDAPTGSLMARLNLAGSKMMPGLCEELGVDYRQNGALVVCSDESTRPDLEALLARGIANGVEGLRIVERDELLELEPHVSDAAVAALFAPTSGIVNPFQLNIALAENANTNGVEFRLLTEVKDVVRTDDGRWELATTKGSLTASVVVNAAGVYADKIHNLVSKDTMTIIPRRGQFFVLDTTVGDYVSHTIFALPTILGKGVAHTPTTSGNLLVGPTAEDIDDKEGVDTSPDGLNTAKVRSAITVKNAPFGECIRTFSGLRAHRAEHEFAIGEVEGAPGFVDCAAIESPGLSSSPAIGQMVAGIVCDILGSPAIKPDWQPRRTPIPNVERLTQKEWEELISKRPDYGRVVCRCKRVTEGQIVDAIHSPLGARSLDAVKRRCEAGMGRCQGGFCTPKIMEILEREVADLSPLDVTKMGPGSSLVVGRTKMDKGGDPR